MWITVMDPIYDDSKMTFDTYELAKQTAIEKGIDKQYTEVNTR